jgi:hypothetical protein
MALEHWALPQLSEFLPLDEESLKEIILYTNTLPDAQAAEHLGGLLGNSPRASEFITAFNARRSTSEAVSPKAVISSHDFHQADSSEDNALPAYTPPSYSLPPPSQSSSLTVRHHTNPVIEAAHVRARDEVRLFLPSGTDPRVFPKSLNSM